MISLEVYCDSHTLHLQQLYTGLAQLHNRGVIRLRQRMDTTPTKAKWPGLKVLVNGATLVYYDMHDSANINNEAMEEVAFYFKRSFTEEHSREHGTGKVFPFGLNYYIYNGRADFFKMARDVSFGSACSKIRRVVKQVVFGNFPTGAATRSNPMLWTAPSGVAYDATMGPAQPGWVSGTARRRGQSDSGQLCPTAEARIRRPVFRRNKARRICVQVFRRRSSARRAAV